MSRKRPKKWKEDASLDKEAIDKGLEKKEQKKEEYDAFEFMKNKKQSAAIAGAFFVVGFLISWMVNPSMSGMIVGGPMVSSDQIGEDVVAYINGNLLVEGYSASLREVNEKNGMYEVSVDVIQDGAESGQNVKFHVSGDGDLLFFNEPVDMSQPLTPPEQPEPETGVPKSDKPVVDLFIWSYCPYGVSAQAPMAEVASLFGDNVEFNAIMYYDGHGAYETQQNKIQACIQKVDKGKYWDYAKGFVEKVYPACSSSRDVECDKTESVNLMDSLGIDSSAVISCVEDEGDALIAQDSQYAAALGVRGSPTIAINGVVASPSSRTAEAFKSSVCQAFNTPPTECSTQLDSTAAAAQGNC